MLAAVPGTPQARNAVVEAQIPQTATVPRKGGPTFAAKYDGAPQFVDEPGTQLARAVNASVPVIRAGNAYYAVKTGIWFTATQPAGPWSVATSVPASIYAIPPTSPIYYATFVRIYGSTDNAVFEGYTPGYLGAYVAPGGTVVYGTGYDAKPWIGDAWYPGAGHLRRCRNACLQPASGIYLRVRDRPRDARRSPAAAQFHPGYWGRYPCCASTSANVYRAWFKPAKRIKPSPAPATIGDRRRTGGRHRAAASMRPPRARTRTPGRRCPSGTWGRERGYDMSMITNADAANAGPVPPPAAPTYISANEYYASLARNGGWDASTAANDTYAGADGKVYRAQRDGWQQHSPGGWSAAPPPPDVVAQAQSRASVDPGTQAGSFGMSNATRFTGQPADGWSRRDAGDGGYSRTLGGDGGISAEYNNYRDAVLNNEFDIAMNGGWWSDAVVVGWGGRLGGIRPSHLTSHERRCLTRRP